MSMCIFFHTCSDCRKRLLTRSIVLLNRCLALFASSRLRKSLFDIIYETRVTGCLGATTGPTTMPSDICSTARLNVHTFEHIYSLPLVQRPKSVLLVLIIKNTLLFVIDKKDIHRDVSCLQYFSLLSEPVMSCDMPGGHVSTFVPGVYICVEFSPEHDLC